MNELSLFTGAGGGLLGTHLLGWRPIGYVEYDDYCQKIIAARIRDGILPEAPIFGDIRAFISEGYADSYSGLVDVVSAGFPCQPFSVAGKRAGADDSRNMWPETLDVLRRVRPGLALLENVPGLLAHEYARRIYGDLADSGFDAIWRRLSAAETGAPHKRDRWFCVAYASESGPSQRELHRRIPRQAQSDENRAAAVMDSETRDRKILANAGSDGKPQSQGRIKEQRGRSVNGGQNMAEPKCGGPQGSWWAFDPGYSTEEEHREKHRAFDDGRWGAEPPMGRVANGVAHRVDRLRGLGNGQVPAVVATAWQLLTTAQTGQSDE